MKKSCKHIAENGECLTFRRRSGQPYYCHWKSCPLYERKEAQPKKIDVVQTMDKIERRESLEEGKKP